jgi:hypothetical protein
MFEGQLFSTSPEPPRAPFRFQHLVDRLEAQFVFARQLKLTQDLALKIEN